MDQIINYILTFLLGVEKASAYASLIGYTSNPNLSLPAFLILMSTGQPNLYLNSPSWK